MAFMEGDLTSFLNRIGELHGQTELGGGQERIAAHYAARTVTARGRIDLVLHPGSFVELDNLVTHRCTHFGAENKRIPGDGFVTGHGLIQGRSVGVFAHNFTVFGGSLGETNAKKVVKVMDLAMRNGFPVTGLNDCGGARLIFVGPAPKSIRAMGDEISLRTRAKKANVPMPPGSNRAISTLDEARAMAEDTGHPIMVKTSAGGGGKGMRLLKNGSS